MKLLLFPLLIALLATLPACAPDEEVTAIQAPPVMVATVSSRTLIDRIQSTGELLAVDEASVAAEVEGRITATPVREGAAVHEGDIVMEIDREKRLLELASEQARVSDPILLSAAPPRSVLVISAPVVSGGKFRGVLSAVVELQRVWESVVARNPKGHLIFAVDGRGRVIASTDPSQIRPGLVAEDSELVQRFLSIKGRETLPFVATHDGVEERYLGSYVVSEQEWGVFVQAKQRDFYQPVQRMISSTLKWSAIALVSAIAAAIVLGRALSNPAKRLASAARALAAGDYSIRTEVRSRNEIGELAYTFNKMACEIEDHIRRLRQAAEENQELFLGTIRALAQAIDAKDPYTRGHSVRVNRYSVLLARELGLSEREIREIHVSSLMHDVGKIGIDDHILKKPGKLTEGEFEVMKTHPVLGANIMAPIRKMKQMLPGLRWHHERWAGGGYPDGLEGERIPLMARIIAVADAFDAMTTHRPYQKAMTFAQAHHRLNELKSVAFEVRIVEAFNRAYARGEIRPEPDEPAFSQSQDTTAVPV